MVIDKNNKVNTMRENIFAKLGFQWEHTSFPYHELSVKEVVMRFNRSRAKFVWETGHLENNPFTFVEVQTLLDGITVGGHKLSDEDQIRGIASSADMLIDMVAHKNFNFSLETMCRLHYALAEKEALDAGLIRGTGEASGTPNVFLGELGEYTPPLTEPGGENLKAHFADAASALRLITNPLERGIAAYLFVAKEQPFYDGNKRTGRLLMNGILMSEGVDAISIPAAKQQEYNAMMCRYYASFREAEHGDASEAMGFMANIYTKFIESQKERVITVIEANTEKGIYKGPVVNITDNHFTQAVGKELSVRHQFAHTRSECISIGENIKVLYKDGIGKVTELDRENEKGNER